MPSKATNSLVFIIFLLVFSSSILVYNLYIHKKIYENNIELKWIDNGTSSPMLMQKRDGEWLRVRREYPEEKIYRTF